MKKSYLLMVWIFVLSTIIPNSLKAQDKWDGETVATKFFAGTGTQSNPYIIRTGAECAFFLKEISKGNAFEGKYIRLGNDIIFDSKYDIGNSGTFAGDFDGNRHYLSSVYGPFIPALSGSIHDLEISIYSLDYGLASIVSNNTETGHIYNCYVKTDSRPYSSGLAALAVYNDGIIDNCYATGNIFGRGEYGLGYRVAALVYDNKGILRNCASEVSVRDYGGSDVSSNLTYTNTGSVIDCFQGKNDIATMFNPSGTTCTIEYVDTMRFVNLASTTISKGQQIGNLPTPDYDWTFVGWYRNGEIVKETDVVNTNWTLFAKWEQQIKKQPTKEDMSIRVDDSQHATYQWFMLNFMPMFFADWQSTNHGRESTSSQTYTFENCKDYVLSFHYNVSSESVDCFTARLNGNVLVSKGGKYSMDYSYVIPDNGQYTLELSYSKDDSESEGKDMVEVSNIMVSPAPQLVANNVTAIQIDPFAEAVYYCIVTYSNSGVSLTSDYVVNYSPKISFADANVKALCVSNWDMNADGELSEEEAAAVTDLGTVFKNNTQIKSFDELQYFTGITGIGGNAFSYCSSLTSVTIPNSVTSIGDYAFCGCSGLTSVTIPNSVTSIEGSAFSGCSGLTSIEIPNSVTSIGSSAFDGCSGLTSISVETGNKNYDSRNNCNAIIETASNTLIAGCKNTTIPNSVTSIGNYAFYQCFGLTSVTIPNSVTSIGEHVFYNCSGLTSVTIPNSVTSIGDYAFSYCRSLTSVTIPNSVTSIGGWAFEGCSGLTSVISEIEEPFAFGTNAFNGISSSCTLTVQYGTRDAYIAAGWTTDVFKGGIVEMDNPNIVSGSCGENVNYSLNLETGVLSITGTGAMADYSSEEEVPWYKQRGNIKSAEIADGVTTIGNNAFNGCSSLTSVTTPNSVTSIGERAFNWCDHLTSFDIPNSVTSIGNYAFERCDNLTSLTIGNSVTSIGSFAFEQCSFTSIIIPSSVTSMGEKVFAYCTHLTSIVVADGNTKYDSRDNCNAMIETATNTMVLGCKNTIIPNSVTSIGSDAFYTCTELTSIEIPSSVTSIGSDAFGRCHSLTSVTIPNSVTEIGPWAFCDCNSLTSVTIPNSVTSIQACAFNRTGLTSVEIPNSVTLIEERVFEDCSGLTSIDIPNSVTSIGYAAFNRSGLTSVTIPNSVTLIRELAFSDCSELTEVYCNAVNVPNTDVTAFDGVDLSNATLYVPAASIEAYKAAEPWSQFANITKTDTDISLLDNVIYVESLEGHSDSQIALPIQMKNSAAIRGFQFNLYLPEGVTIAQNAKGKLLVSLSSERRDEYDEHTLSVAEQKDGSFLFLCGSLSEDTFLGNDGEIATVTLNIDENVEDGDYPIILKNIKLTENNISKYYETPQVRSTLSIVSYMLGDINGDGKIDVSDYIGIANHILGDTPEDFIMNAADVDENGVIDVSDYIGVANIILSGSIYGSQQ